MKKIFLILMGVSFTLASMAATTKEIVMTEAGTISEMYTYSEVATWTKLVITGPMNDADFTYLSDDLRKWATATLSVVDLSGTTGLTTISNGGFAQLNVLTSVKLPEGITSIEAGAFYNDKELLNVNLPSTLKKIGANAFYNCKSMMMVTLPNGLETIGKTAFINCGTQLTSLTIPASVTSIGDGAFAMMPVQEFVISGDNPNYTVSDKVLYTKDLTKLVQVPAGIVGNVEVASSVTAFGDFCAAGCEQMTNINIPAGVTSIGQGAFMNDTKLEKLSIPSATSSIGDLALSGLSGIQDIQVGEGNPIYSSIGGALYTATKDKLVLFPAKKNIESYEIPEGVTEIGESAFYGQAYVQHVTFPSTLKTISDRAFEECAQLETVFVPESVDSIGREAFALCPKLKAADIRANITALANNVFINDAALTQLSLPASLKSIGMGSLSGIGAEVIVLPENVERIGMLSMSYCPNLKKVYMGSKVTYFGDEIMYNLVFNESNNITDVYLLASSSPVAGADCFMSISDSGQTNWSIVQNATLHVPSAKKYKDTTWEECFGDVVGDFTQEDYEAVLKSMRDETAATDIEAPATVQDDEVRIVSIYSANGQQLPKLQKGLNIVRMSNGTTKKIMVK